MKALWMKHTQFCDPRHAEQTRGRTSPNYAYQEFSNNMDSTSMKTRDDQGGAINVLDATTRGKARQR